MTTAIALLFGNLFRQTSTPRDTTVAGAVGGYEDEPEYELILTQDSERKSLKRGALDDVLAYADGSISLKKLNDKLSVEATGEAISVFRFRNPSTEASVS